MKLVAEADGALLQACMLDGPAALDAFRRWRPHGQPGTLDGRNLRLMPLLYQNLKRLQVDDPMMPWLRGLAKHIWLTGSVRLQHVDAVLGAFAAAGLPVVLIKGAALLARWKSQMETRPMGDFDLLMPPSRVREALSIMARLGWETPPLHMLNEGDLRRGHALGVRAGREIYLDLHWRPAAAIRDPAFGAAVLARGVPARLGALDVQVANLADHFFILLAHALFNASDRRFDWLAEACILLRLAGKEVDWALFRGLVRRYRMQSWVRLALRDIAAVMDGELPAGALPAAPLLDGIRQRREIAARGIAHATPVAGVVRAFSDVRRAGERRLLAPLVDPAVLAQLRNLPRLRPVLPQAALLRLTTYGRVPMARLGALGADGFQMTRDDAGTSFLTGWAQPETFGRWTDGETAWMLLRAPGRKPGPVQVSLEADAVPATLVPGLPWVEADIWAGGGLAGGRHRFRFGGETPDRIVEFGGQILRWRGETVLPVAIEFASPVDPALRGSTTMDPRRLGLFLKWIEITAEYGAPEAETMRAAAPWMAGFGRVATDRLGAITGQGFRVAEDMAGASFIHGWTPPESGGRWTEGKTARLMLRAPGRQPGPVQVRLNAVSVPAGLVPAMPHVEAEIWAGGGRQRVRLDGGLGAWSPIMLEGRILHWRGAPVLPLVIEFATPLDPASRGMTANDLRHLGLLLSAVSIT